MNINRAVATLILFVVVCIGRIGFGATQNSGSKQQEERGESVNSATQDEIYATPELLAARKGNTWIVPVAENGTTKIPRVCSSLRDAYWQGMPDKKVAVHPEIEYWELRIKNKPLASHIVLEFDSRPITVDEAKPIQQLGDGTLTLPCSHGLTHGEKLRFEPQPHKNTIGYWVIDSDHVSWTVDISKPASFNVGLLQGAGKNGGGTATVSLIEENGRVVDSFEYKVQVTGHFQNFRWKHGGELEVKEAGIYTIQVRPAKIDKTALMDIRQVHLSPKR